MASMTKYIITVLLFTSSIAFGQGHKIEVNLESAASKQVFLAHYYISNIYIDDTLKLDANGSGVLTADTLLPQGLYKIYLDENNHFDFLLGADQQLIISNKTFKTETIKISGATETEEFIRYVHFLSGLKIQSAKIQERIKEADESEKSELRQNLSMLTKQIHAYWKETSDKYPDTFLSKFLMSDYVPTFDETKLSEEIQQNDSLLLLARFKFQQDHYWDYFDYTDERFLYTPFLKPKMEKWFTKILFQKYDSVQPYVFKFIEDVRPSKRIFQFATSFFLNSSIQSKIMGMDALFVDLAKAYYLNGEAYWATEESLQTIRENIQFMEPNLIGKTAPDLTLESFDGDFYNLHQVDKKRTVVVIYEPNCSHCKVFVPKFYNDVYLKYREKGLEVFAIYSMDNKEEWGEFLEKHKLWDWINVWDKDHLSGFKVLYDARTTPAIFVLDENKKIIAKKLSVQQLDDVLNYDLN